MYDRRHDTITTQHLRYFKPSFGRTLGCGVDMRRTTRYDEGMRFADDGTRDIMNGVDSPQARRAIPHNLLSKARNKIYLVLQATVLIDLKSTPGNKLHPLEDNRAGQHAIWINDKYRVCFRWVDNLAMEIEVTYYH
jgi:proteic killer suppression protein